MTALAAALCRFFDFFDLNELPTASTCALSLNLPVKHEDYYKFKEKFTFAMKNQFIASLAKPFFIYRWDLISIKKAIWCWLIHKFR